MSIEQQVKEYKTLSAQIAELDARRKALGKEILQQMPAYAKCHYVDEWVVRRYSRVTIKTTLEEAKGLGLSKVEEVVDKDKIKELFERGQMIPNVSKTEYITVMKASDRVSSAMRGYSQLPTDL